jgi:hypothetical protein
MISRRDARSRGLSFLLALVACILLLAVGGAAPALAGGTWWHLASTAVPTNLPRGSEGHPGEGQVVVTATNLGSENANASAAHPLRIRDVLPAGLQVVVNKELSGYEEGPLHGRGRRPGETDFPCQLETVEGHEQVSCLAPAVIPANEGLEVVIPVKVTESIPSGTELENEAKIEGGEGGVPSAASREKVRVASASTQFGIDGYELRMENEDGSLDTQAGSHPFQQTTNLRLNQVLENNAQAKRREGTVPAAPRNLHFVLPPGLLGNVNGIIPQCTAVDFTTILSQNVNLCPENTAVGVARVTINEPIFFHGVLTETIPVFNLVPAKGEPARFGFEIQKVTVILTTAVRIDKHYAVEVSINNASQLVGVLGSEVTFWGVPDRKSVV